MGDPAVFETMYGAYDDLHRVMLRTQRRMPFLKELRRINVAISRARRQLVVVGDRDTLCGARNRGFAELAVKMIDYLERGGAVHPSLHVEQRVSRSTRRS